MKFLHCGYTQVSDLTPLMGMPLTKLECPGTKVSDLAPLKGMALTVLYCNATPVTDLTPLRGLPCNNCCDVTCERDTEVLRGLLTLETINDKPAAEYWKGADARRAEFDAWVRPSRF